MMRSTDFADFHRWNSHAAERISERISERIVVGVGRVILPNRARVAA